MIRSLLLALAILFCATASAQADVGIPAVSAQSSGNLASLSSDPLGLGKAAEFKGLFDSKRLTFQHTVGMSFSSGGGGFTQYYLNTITYKAAEPLTVQAQVGLQHNVYGKALYGSSNAGSARIVVPEVPDRDPVQQHPLLLRLQKGLPVLRVLRDSIGDRCTH